MFEQRHYIAIAAVLAQARHDYARHGAPVADPGGVTADLAERLADLFAQRPQFKRAVFLRAACPADLRDK